ncbi:MAG: nucleotidyltransferase domain-containing protein [Candidatus Wallbacteria bacterium]|nr:nucleotidyltransferase domain-containing protein [Candidatus Wallbacteria bacterium]
MLKDSSGHSSSATIDLPAAWLRQVIDVLSRRLPGVEVRVFGSRVLGSARSYSDLDLAVVAPERIPWRLIEQLREDFQESDLPVRVDIVDWHTLTEGLRAVIERRHVVLQCAVQAAPPTPDPGTSSSA